jgi:hypothetical protein
MLRRFAAFAILLPALVAWGCTEDESPVQPTSTSSAAFFAPLNAPQVQPVGIAGPNTPAGSMSMTLQVTTDSVGNIQTAAGIFNGSFTGFPQGSSLTSAHVNSGAAGTIGPIVIDLGILPGQVLFPNGFGSFITTIAVAPAVAAQILANPSGFYFEADTAQAPAGAVRGQFVNVTVVAR